MLGFERHVVAALITTDDATVRAGVESFVERSLHAMPEHLRLGVIAETCLVAGLASVLRLRGKGVRDVVESLDASPVALLRQYVRLFRSLVLFAEQELAPGAAA